MLGRATSKGETENAATSFDCTLVDYGDRCYFSAGCISETSQTSSEKILEEV
jgi:hypothetical protein